ncbi:MAG: carboxypeptidase-like regulatory domain-containing protein [Thermoplasmatota archaeon]
MRWMALLLLTTVLAGCADELPQEATDDLTFDDDLSATDTTGVIRGVVVNDAIEPVAGATVLITGLEITDETDEQGRFTFSNLEPGTYFLDVTKDLHTAVQANVEVQAGIDAPPVLKVQLNRLYSGDPYLVTMAMDGFFTCSQAGTIVWGYSSSPCHSIGWGTNIDLCDDYGACLDQERVFHVDLDAGWQSIIYEMDWEATAQGTSERMGMSVSTYHPERNKNHWFASVSSEPPMYFAVATGEMHPTSQEGDGPAGPIPADGMTDMSMYMSVREPDPCTGVVYCPGFAIDQKFQAWHSQFYYQPAPEGWSFRNGDTSPF